MDNDVYKLAREKAQSELNDLIRQRDEIEARIFKLADTVQALQTLSTDEPKSFQSQIRGLGLTDAIREILKSSRLPLSATQIRAVLLASQFDLSEQSNPMASIHSVLKRLAEAKEIVPDQSDDAGTTYMWLTPIRRALLKEAEDRKEFLKRAFSGPPQLSDIEPINAVPPLNVPFVTRKK